MAKVTGGKGPIDKLNRMSGPEAAKQLGATLYALGNAIEVEAQISLTTGAVSGKGHVPSKPGEPPNQDTGVLGNNIETTQPTLLRVEVSSNAPYAVALEYGTSKMAERPYMRPAAAKVRKSAPKTLAQAIRVIRRGGKVTG